MNTPTQKLSKRKIILVGVCLLAVFAAGSIWWWIRSNTIVSTDDARVKGTLTVVSPKVNGRIEKLLVDEGDHVVAGQTIAVLEKKDYELDVEQARANLAVAKAKRDAVVAGNRPQDIAAASAKVLQQKALYLDAQKNYNRSVELYHQAAISAQQRDASRATFLSAQAQYKASQEEYDLSKEGSRAEDIAAAEAAVRQADAALKTAETQLADTMVKAPANGTVGLKSVENGEVVIAGQPFFTIADLDTVWIGANIEETYVGKIKIGNKVRFTIDAYPGVTFTGSVIEAGPAASSQFALIPNENTTGNFTKVTQRLPIKIKPDPTDYILKPGMSAIVEIRVK